MCTPDATHHIYPFQAAPVSSKQQEGRHWFFSCSSARILTSYAGVSVKAQNDRLFAQNPSLHKGKSITDSYYHRSKFATSSRIGSRIGLRICTCCQVRSIIKAWVSIGGLLTSYGGSQCFALWNSGTRNNAAIPDWWLVQVWLARKGPLDSHRHERSLGTLHM